MLASLASPPSTRVLLPSACRASSGGPGLGDVDLAAAPEPLHDDEPERDLAHSFLLF